MGQGQRLRWSLENLYSGGVQSAELAAELGRLDAALGQWPQVEPTAEAFVKAFDDAQHLGSSVTEAEMFVHCLGIDQPSSRDVKVLKGRIADLKARLQAFLVHLDQWMFELPDAEWQAVLASPSLVSIDYLLNDLRVRLAQKMNGDRELLMQSLSPDGYHAWGDLYFQVLAKMRIPFEVDGEQKELTRGQMWGYQVGADPALRAKASEAVEAAFASEAELIAALLNHLAGFRLNVYRHRGLHSALQEPLAQNQMTEATLQAMWEAVEAMTEPLTAFCKRKGELIGSGVVSHFDLFAPIGDVSQPISFDEAANLIVQQFGRFAPQMGEYAAEVFANGWIDAEHRPDKHPGGQCIPFHLHKESRITLAYQDDVFSLLVLAHELGHGYHNATVHDLPFLAREYPMSVAETASTFAEIIVLDAAIAEATSDEQRLQLLGAKMQRAIPLILGVRGGFLFEKRFYEQRANGPLSADELCALMSECQQIAFQGVLDRTNPYQWASQGHFYSTEVPFYNFQYTFGYLFSTGLYARALREGAAFGATYEKLLRDTGRMSVEELARTHLGVDLTDRQFWQEALELLVQDVETFLELSK